MEVREEEAEVEEGEKGKRRVGEGSGRKSVRIVADWQLRL